MRINKIPNITPNNYKNRTNFKGHYSYDKELILDEVMRRYKKTEDRERILTGTKHVLDTLNRVSPDNEGLDDKGKNVNIVVSFGDSDTVFNHNHAEVKVPRTKTNPDGFYSSYTLYDDWTARTSADDMVGFLEQASARIDAFWTSKLRRAKQAQLAEKKEETEQTERRRLSKLL